MDLGALASATVTALKGFAEEVSTWTNQGSLISIEGHIAQIESAAAQDVHAGETAAKAVWGDLYGAFHGHGAEAAPVVDAPAAPAAPAPVEDPAPAAPAPAEAAPVAADPTPAPSTTAEGSSAPSSTPSTSTEPAAPAAPTA